MEYSFLNGFFNVWNFVFSSKFADFLGFLTGMLLLVVTIIIITLGIALIFDKLAGK